MTDDLLLHSARLQLERSVDRYLTADNPQDIAESLMDTQLFLDRVVELESARIDQMDLLVNEFIEHVRSAVDGEAGE
jgi:hypothetical protein